MLGLLGYHPLKSKILETISISLTRQCHLKITPTSDSSNQSSPPSEFCVGIFWDLKSKPNFITPAYDVACAVVGASHYFGTLRHIIAYADSTSYTPYPNLRERFDCEVCNKNFYDRHMLISHLKKKHEPGFKKYMADKRAGIVKMTKGGTKRRKMTRPEERSIRLYSQAMRHLLGRSDKRSMAHEVKRAGFMVYDLSENPSDFENAMKSHMVDLIRMREVQCVILITEKSNLCDVLKEAKMGGLKTIVVGFLDEQLKGSADTWFTWASFMNLKALCDTHRDMNK